MKVCNIFELPKPSNEEIKNILSLDSNRLKNLDDEKVNVIVNYIEGDMRKLKFSLEVLNENENIDKEQILKLFHLKSYNEDSKSITNQLLEKKYDISMHNNLMNETDRTIVALLWHENVIDKLEQKDKQRVYPIYYKILRNICFADYIDRITFQSQIWEFNEMSSLIKTFYNNKIFHDSFENEEFKSLN